MDGEGKVTSCLLTGALALSASVPYTSGFHVFLLFVGDCSLAWSPGLTHTGFPSTFLPTMRQRRALDERL